MYLENSKTIVVKIGSSLIIDDKKIIRKKWLLEFAKDIKVLRKKKFSIIEIHNRPSYILHIEKYFSKKFKPYVIGKIIKGQKKVSLNGSINWL